MLLTNYTSKITVLTMLYLFLVIFIGRIFVAYNITRSIQRPDPLALYIICIGKYNIHFCL